MNKKPLTILWHSVSPHIRSGYGKTTYNICKRLVNAGYRIVISAYYGLEPGGVLNLGGMLVVPAKQGPFGQLSAANYARQFKTDIQVLNTDWWAFTIFPSRMHYPVLHSPMDHINYPNWIIELTKQYRKVLAYCKFQQKELKRRGIDSYYMPHGVDTKIYKPLNKEKCKQAYSLSGKFVFGTVAANTDKETRKSHLEMMKAMQYFLEQNPDVRKDIAWIYHTNPKSVQGVDLSIACNKYGLDDIIRFMSPEIEELLLPEEEMAKLYNCFDVFLLASRREGFCLPLLETMACGVPAIGHSFSSFPELIGSNRGWLAKSLTTGLNMVTTPILGDCALVDVYDLAEQIKKAYFSDKQRERYGRNAYKFALQFDWDLLIQTKWIPFLQEVEEEVRAKDIYGISEEKNELWEQVAKRALK